MTPIELNRIHRMDCLDGLRQMEAGSVDLVATDPPYGLSFMGKDWDKAVPPLEIWRECLRVLKPGAFAFVMCAPRADVQAEMIIRLRDAGFWVGFTPIYWAYASGFPKAMNIGRAIDKRAGIERGIVGEKLGADRLRSQAPGGVRNGNEKWGNESGRTPFITAPATPEAKALNGSYAGFQPKPAVEVVLVAMKPLSEKTFVDQALKNGKGVTWLDEGRIPYKNGEIVTPFQFKARSTEVYGYSERKDAPEEREINSQGRFPANLLVSDGVLDDGRITSSKESHNTKGAGFVANSNVFHNDKRYEVKEDCLRSIGDSGSFSRYFSLDAWWAERIKKLPPEVRKTFPFLLVPKASKGEKNEGCDEMALVDCQPAGLAGADSAGHEKPREPRQNFHPTVKPLQLMSYLMTLGSREGDLVLDPFAGSGTTAVACRILNRRFIGFEISEEYCKIAEARVGEAMAQRKLTDLNQYGTEL